MGLLSIFSKKSSDKLSGNLRAQAYSSTAPSYTPQRGTYPVAGNGRNVFDSLHRSHYQLSETQLTGVAVPGSSAQGTSNPAFGVPRPSTAPNGEAPPFSAERTPTRTRREAARGPPVSLKSRKVDSLSGPQSNIESEPETSRQATWERPKPPFAPVHARHVSTPNTASSRFVDILDAQSEIKPSSFRNRVRAAGAKDYGEDVADRNIGVNGVNLTSAPVQAFYATSSGGSSQSNQSTPVPAAVWTNKHKEEGAFISPRRPFEYADNSLRTRSLNLESFNSYSKRATLFQPREPGAPPSKKPESPVLDRAVEHRGRRRQPVSSFIPSGEAPPTPGSKPRPKSLHRSTLSGTDIGRQEASSSRRPNTSHDRARNELGIFTPPLPTTTPVQPPRSPLLPRDLVLLAKKNGPTPLSPPPVVMPNQPATNQRPKSAARPKSRHGPVGGFVFPAPNGKDLSKRHSMTSAVGGGESSRHRPRSSRGDWPRSARAEPGFDSRGFLGRVDIDNSTGDAGPTSPAPSPHVLRAGHARSDSREFLNSYPRTRSMVSLGRYDDIYEHIPMRTSSLRHWSMTSTAPTTASLSSSPFGRPHSSHTANTSVDLAKFSAIMTSSRSSLDSRAGGYAGSMAMGLDSRLHSPLTSASVYASGNFNIDDYLSSDDDIDADSYVTPRRKRGEEEEGLLFRDTGYGAAGLQLPGLFDAIPEVPSESTPQDPQHLCHAHRSPSRLSQRLSLDTPRSFAPGYDYDDEDEDSDDDYYQRRTDLVPGKRGMKRLSALGNKYGPIEEENLEKVDVRTAIRLRKEAKARKRARSKKGKGKDKDNAVGVVDLDEDNMADAEL